MDLGRPLAVVTPTVEADVLWVLAGADAEFTPPQIHSIVKTWSEAGIRKALQRLVRTGVVEADRKGNAFLYRLNRQHLAADAIIELADIPRRFVDRLREAIAGWEQQPSYAAMFGSAARDEMRDDSDVDVFVVRPEGVESADDTWRDQLHRLEREASAWIGNDVRILEYGESEANVGLENREPVLMDILRDGIRLGGRTSFRQPG
jgi:predicted nucleotidyltransferase